MIRLWDPLTHSMAEIHGGELLATYSTKWGPILGNCLGSLNSHIANRRICITKRPQPWGDLCVFFVTFGGGTNNLCLGVGLFLWVALFVCLVGCLIFSAFSLQGYVHHQTVPFEIDISSFVTIKQSNLRWSLSQNEWLIRNPAGIPDDGCIHSLEDTCIHCGCPRILAKEPSPQSGISWKIGKIISSSWHDGGFAHTIT